MYTCKECKYKTANKTNYSKHLTTAKHKNLCLEEFNNIEEEWNAKPRKKYHCNLCFFESAYKIHYDRHLDSLKHIKNQEKYDEIKRQIKEKKELYDAEERKAKENRRIKSIFENEKIIEQNIALGL
jgi:hypothetical protein